MEQTRLNFDGELIEIGELKRSKIPLKSKVYLDEFTNMASKNFDFYFDGENEFYPFEFNDILKELDFNILCIVGASGSGKSTFSKYFGEEEILNYDNKKAIISHFENPNDAIEKLMAVGLNSIPTWCKPRNVLSIGEGFRVDLARKLKNNCVIDEFTSTVDRNVAISCAKSVGEYIRNKNLKKCVFVSCHKDFIDTLCPDYIVDLDDKKIYDTRGLLRRKFKLSIYEKQNKREIWEIFRGHHYLSNDINLASRLYVGYFNDDIVCMCAVLPLPGMIKNAYRIHRLIVLPDYQGLGIGTKLLKEICKLYSSVNKKMYIRTSHIKLYNYMIKSNDWIETARSGVVSPQQGVLWKVIDNRIAYSFKYVGSSKSILNNFFIAQNKKIKKSKIEKISLLDI